MIVKNTYGLSIILSEKSIKNRNSDSEFAGSSLDRKKATPKSKLKEIAEENKRIEKQLDTESQNEVLKFFYEKFPETSVHNIFIAEPTEEYDNRFHSISQNNEEGQSNFLSLVEYGQNWGYTEAIEENSNIDRGNDNNTLNLLEMGLIDVISYGNIVSEEKQNSSLYQKESDFYNENQFSNSYYIIDEQYKAENKKRKKKAGKLRSMSPRTKQKIRKKVTAFSQRYKKLNFLTLTFVNKVEDKQAVSILGKFLDNCTKQLKDFQYIWVSERQTKNETFQDNIHFHLITNKYFKIDKYWEYWNKLQEKHGITPRNKNFNASSSFDIRRLNDKNIKAIGQYITKYIIKNKDEFDCQVWNCSKGVSILYTDMYTGYEFIENMEKVLETEIEPIPAEHCTVYPVPLNRRTLPMYERLNEKNRQIMKMCF
jgi:hypothetical protein